MTAMLALLVHSKRWRFQVALAVLVLASSFVFCLNGTRGALIASGSVFFVLPWMIPRRSWKSILLSYGIIITLAIARFQAPYVQEPYRSAVANIVQYQQNQPRTSVGCRIEMWKTSVQVFREHLVIGADVGDWQYEVQRLVRKGRAPKSIKDYNQTHNIFLDALSTQGLLGLAALLALITVPLQLVRRADGADAGLAKALVVLATVSFVVSGMSDTLVHIRGVFTSYLMLIGIALALQAEGAGMRSAPGGIA